VIKAGAGPFGKSINDLVTVFKIQTPEDINFFDSSVAPCTFREDLY
jgi:hypothetical protein